MAIFVNWKNLTPTEPGCGGRIYNVLNRHNCELIKLELAIAVFQVGEKGQKHYHKWTEEIYHVLKGNGIIGIGIEKIEVGPDDSIAFPVNTPHMIENTGKEPFVLLCLNSCPYDTADVFTV